ncbi:MAG: glycosyltransferase [Cyanobacteria bacterium P01_D01_bin.105]
MKILIVHNRYKERTGEDAVFDRETKLLRAHGNQVNVWTVDNRDITTASSLDKIALAKSTISSSQTKRDIYKNLCSITPDIVHVHNMLPLISPSVFHACNQANVPVVHTLHNYRLVCPSNTLFRDGQICEKCISGSLLNSIRYSCYRDSRLQTAVVAAMLQYHRWIKTWENSVDGYIALSEFQREKILRLGIPRDKIYIKPNFIESIPPSKAKIEFGSYYLFAGRLIDEKGIYLLIEGYKKSESKYPLVIMGPGHLHSFVLKATSEDSRIQYVGIQSKQQVLDWMRKAIALLFPSIWFECSPMTILEAYSCSLPVVSTNLGAIPDMVKHKKTGFVTAQATAEEFSIAIQWIEQNLESWVSLKRDLSKYIDPIYFPSKNYQRIIETYKDVISSANSENLKSTSTFATLVQ